MRPETTTERVMIIVKFKTITRKGNDRCET